MKIVIGPEQLPILGALTMADAWCYACGTFVGAVRVYPRNSFGLASACEACIANHRHATGPT